jgi:cytosine/adenosine deaminase-related metal-dependent hydrolase
MALRLVSDELTRNFSNYHPFMAVSPLRGGRQWQSLTWLLICLMAVFHAKPAFAKQRVDLIVVHGMVVTMDGTRRVLTDGAIAVQGDAIAAIDSNANIDARYESDKVIDARGGLVLPGLINAHTHMSMSLFRGLADDLSLDDWLNKYIFPAEHRYVTRDFVTWSTRLSMLEMLRGGTTTVADMYYFEEDVAAAMKAAGMRGVLGETLIGFPSPDSATPAAALTYTELFLKHWKGDPLITPAVAPHSIYTCPETLLKDAAALARRGQAPLLIHVAEAPFELEKSRHDHGLTPVQYLSRIGVLGPNVLAAHCIWLDQADVETLAHVDVGCSYNPSSNMKTAAGLMPAVELLEAGVAVVSPRTARPATTTKTCLRRWTSPQSSKSSRAWILRRCRRSRWLRWQPSLAHARCILTDRSVPWKWARRQISSWWTPALRTQPRCMTFIRRSSTRSSPLT